MLVLILGLTHTFNMLFIDGNQINIPLAYKPLTLVAALLVNLAFYGGFSFLLIRKHQWARLTYSLSIVMSVIYYSVVTIPFLLYDTSTPLEVSYLQLSILVAQLIGAIFLYDPALDDFFEVPAKNKSISTIQR